jgi:signal transduction histidine kinase
VVTTGADPALPGRRRLFVEGLVFRVALCVAFALMFLGLASAGLFPRGRAVAGTAILAVLAAMNGVYWSAGRRAGFPTRHFFAHWAVDIGMLTLLVHQVGGIDAPYGALAYAGLVTFAAVNDSRRTALLLASFSLLAFALLVALEASGVVPRAEGIWRHHYAATAVAVSLVAPFVFLFAVAWVAGTLADHLKSANASLVEVGARIEEQNRTLERRVAERTAELERAHAEIEDLVHIVTHDLKNVSVAATETARKLIATDGEGLSPRGRRYADHLLDDTRGMTRMLENLLSLFRVGEEEGEARQWVDVDAIVRDSFRRLGHEVERRGIRVSVGPLPAAFADPVKMRHVFDNLVDNACKYVGENHPARVEVEGERRGGEVTYRVRDNGIGIDERQLERIFQLYHRSPNQTVGGVAQPGHGVGLAIAKRIVERHGGRIDVESAPGRGSTFIVALPLPEEGA